MFYCYLHKWNHIESQCPLCPAPDTTVSSSSIVVPVQSMYLNQKDLIKGLYETIDKLEKENAELKNATPKINALLSEHLSKIQSQYEMLEKLAGALRKCRTVSKQQNFALSPGAVKAAMDRLAEYEQWKAGK